MAEDDTSSREGLLNTIRILEERIASYVNEKRPASTRLSTISIVSSSIAAALTIGPAAGGLKFAETVRHGLDLSQSQTVWRALCIAATMVAVVAAISANLNKSNDLTGRIKLVEGCSAELDVLRNRFELRKLSVGEALNRYEEIRARIPFIVIPPAGVEGLSARRPKDWVAGSLVTAIVVAFLVVLLTLGGLFAGLLRAGPPSPVHRPRPRRRRIPRPRRRGRCMRAAVVTARSRWLSPSTTAKPPPTYVMARSWRRGCKA